MGPDSMDLECSSCHKMIDATRILEHFEEYHAGPRPVEILQLDCFNCKFRVSTEKIQFMINHCVSEGHKYQGISEWRKFIQTEGERMDRLIQLGIETLEQGNGRKFRKPEPTSHQNYRIKPEEHKSSRFERSDIEHYGQNESGEDNQLEYEDGNEVYSDGNVSDDPSNNIPNIRTDNEESWPPKVEINRFKQSGSSDYESPNPVMSYMKGESVVINSESNIRRSFHASPQRKNHHSDFKKTKTSKRTKAETSDGTRESGSFFTPVRNINRETFELMQTDVPDSQTVKEEPDNDWDQSSFNESKGKSSEKPIKPRRKRRPSQADPSRTITCEICKKTVTTYTKFMSDIVRHLSTHDNRLKRYECLSCWKRYDTAAAMRIHLRTGEKLNRKCADYQIIQMSHSDRLKIVEELMVMAFPQISIPDKYRNQRMEPSEIPTDDSRQTCKVCHKNMKVGTTATAVYHAIRHDKSCGWVECACCGQKFDAISGVQKHSDSNLNDCTGEVNELMGPEMAEKIQNAVDRCFPEGKYDVWNMRNMKRMGICK